MYIKYNKKLSARIENSAMLSLPSPAKWLHAKGEITHVYGL